MKKTGLVIIMSAILSSVYALPTQWNSFFYTAKEDKAPVTPALKDNKLILPDGKTVEAKTLKVKENCFDFEKLANGNNHAVLAGVFKSDRERKTYLGVGGLAFAIELNGKMIYDFRRRGLGNDFDPVSVNDHIIPVTLKQGENTIVIRSCRTNWLLDFCYGAKRNIKWHFTIAELPDYQPIKAKLAYHEVMLRPTENSIVFAFVTQSPVPAGVDYRIKGTDKWTREWDLAGELVIRNDRKNHIIRLEDLKADTTYEYRLVLLEPPVGGEIRSLWASRNHKAVFTPVREFRTLGANELNFFALCDTQLSLSSNCQTVAHRDAFMKKMRGMPEYKKADFIVHIGDMTSYFHDVEKDLFGDFFEKFTSTKNAKPWVYVRGNHELDGIDANRWHDYFVMPDEKPYHSFKVKDTLFIVLACGDFVKGGKYNAHIGPILDPATMVRKQRKWLEKLIQTDDYKNAKFRIVLSHIAPQIEKSQVIEEIREIAQPILNDSIHLWVAGHCHYYWRMFKISDILYARNPVKRAPAYRVAKFNWLTLDGPKSSNASPDFSYLSVNIKGDTLHARVIDENGKLMDSFDIDSKGNALELKRGDDIKPFTFPKR